MKKLVILALVLALTAALAMNAFAEDFTPSIEDPGYYTEYDPDVNPAIDGETIIPGWGYIGPDATLIPDLNPDEKPEVEPDDVSKFLHVEVPTQFLWAAFQSEGGDITAPTYKIVNKNDKSNLKVTMKSFEQKGGDNLPGGSSLTLNLTGNLALGNVLHNDSQDHAYETLLGAGQEWTFSFDGEYRGVFPVTYVQPRYEMVLNFAVDSINA